MTGLLLFLAGVLGGAMNSLAGGGSTPTYAALVFIGVPPISAIATNTLAVIPGYISGLLGFRPDWRPLFGALVWQVPLAIIGGLVGAKLLLATPENLFRALVPWLLLFATVVFYAAPQNRKLKARVSLVLAPVILLVIFTYGGYFGAGLGIIMLATLSLLGFDQIAKMNGVKLIFSIANAVAAATLFIQADMIDWQAWIILVLGLIVGAYSAARLALRLSQKTLRLIITGISLSVTTYFFIDYYVLAGSG
jgi:uncharacterized membrane protein YfcA